MFSRLCLKEWRNLAYGVDEAHKHNIRHDRLLTKSDFVADEWSNISSKFYYIFYISNVYIFLLYPVTN